ncbi:MAG: HAD family hydrolase [Pseudomonadota bacterium]
MKKLIALDADGVLLDYHHAYRVAWYRAFGVLPEVKDSLAYWPIDRWDVQRIDGEKLDLFRECFDQYFWSTIPALPGAVDACMQLKEAGYELVCVSALPEQFRAARSANIRDCGFPIDHVVATSHESIHFSPKANALKELMPVAFVDDFLPYLRGIPSEVHAALLMREPNGTPNKGEALSHAHSTHIDLPDFANWWLANRL